MIELNSYDNAERPLDHDEYAVGGKDSTKFVSEPLKDFQTRELLHLLPVGIVLGNAEGKILWCNKQVCAQLGYTPEELTALELDDIEAVETPAQVHVRLAKMFRTGREDRFKTKHLTKSGKLIDVWVKSQPLKLNGQEASLTVWSATKRKSKPFTKRTFRENRRCAVPAQDPTLSLHE
jgi:PAS domain S-box-containing protein